MDTTPALDAALSQENVTIFLCGRADLPNYTLRLLEAAGEVTWSQGTFVGSDPKFGSISALDAISDGIGDQAPSLSITLTPNGETASAELSHPSMQGSRIRLWLGAIDNTTRTVIADPYLLFDGELDQPVLNVDRGSRDLEYECVSAFERLFLDEEGIRLSEANHNEVWPGETGLSDVTGIVKQIIWGPGDKIVGSYGYGSSYGGGGGFGGYDYGGGYQNQVAY